MSEHKDIVIERVNASFVRLYVDDMGIRKTIHEHFTYEEPGFIKNKWTRWDGVVKLFKLRGDLLPYGLLAMLLDLCKTNGWSFELDSAFKSDITKITREDLVEWIKTLNIHSGGMAIEPYDYQIDALFLSIKYNRLVVLAATSAGKSLIAYMLTRYYEMMCNDDGQKVLILVPSQMLVDQMYSDFEDYSSHNGWSTSQNVHTIMEGRPKVARKMVYISTWQSIYKEDPEYFKVFGRVINDETHLASGASIGAIMNNCVNAYQRVGMTGTLKNEKIHPILVMSLFGHIKRVVTTKQLIDSGRATEVNIKVLQLNYEREESEHVASCKYQDEIDFLIKHNYRNKMIASLAATQPGNTLVMLDRLEHIETIRQLLETIPHKKKVYVITGDVKRDERAAIKAVAEAEDGIVVLGTPGCVSTGLSIKRLKNLIFGHPSKSIIRILQAIGRILRLHKEKNTSTVFDLVDNFSYDDHINHALRHAMQRVAIYKEDQFPITYQKYAMKKSVQ